MLQGIKTRLVEMGPKSSIARFTLGVHCRSHGFRLAFEGDKVSLKRGDSQVVLAGDQLKAVPFMMENFDVFFRTFDVPRTNGRRVLDFSEPGFHRYRREGVGFHFPSIAEEDVMDAYTHWYLPRPGDVVFDAGAHAGATSYFFSKMVGPTGRVYAFEPDENNYKFLLRNIELHSLKNVTPVKRALAGTTGELLFSMDGTMGAGLQDYLVYPDKQAVKPVQAATLADICAELDVCPNYIKMDIEGAEVAVLESSSEFLRTHPIHFSIESNHRVNNVYTYHALDRIFAATGYRVKSSEEFGQMFTWGGPSRN